MAAPTFVAAGTGVAGGSSPISPGVPAGHAADDIFLLLVESEPSTTIAASGYSHVTNSPQSGTDSQLAVLWKRAVASESAPSVTFNAGNHAEAQVFAFRGCPTAGNPWDVIAGAVQNTASTSVSIAGTTTTVADCLLAYCIAAGTKTTTPQFSAQANASLTSVTERGDFFGNAGDGGGVSLTTGVKAAAGATGTFTATQASSARYAHLTIALQGAAALGIFGTASITEAGDTLAATGALAIGGTLSVTEVGDTVAATGVLAITGTLSATEAGDTLSSAGTLAIVGTLSITEAGDTLSATGALAITGTLSATENDDTLVAEGTAAITGTLSVAEDGDTLSATGQFQLVPVVVIRHGGGDRKDHQTRQQESQEELRRLIEQAWRIAHNEIEPLPIEEVPPIPPADLSRLFEALANAQAAVDQENIETFIAAQQQMAEDEAIAVLLLA